MTTPQQARFSTDLNRNTITVTRYFDAEPAPVWRAWTEPELLDKWWAPKPYRAETKRMDFRPGGHWMYAMVSPEGERQWVWVDIKTVDPIRNFTCRDNFSDENGTVLADPPGMDWDITFTPDGEGTRVNVELRFANGDDLKKITEMGFEEGFTAAMTNLDAYLAEAKK